MNRRRPMRCMTGALAALVLGSWSPEAAAVLNFQEVANAFAPQPCGGSGCYTNYLRVTDIDNDGDLDVLIPNSSFGGPEPFVVYVNDGNAGFTDNSAAAVGGFQGHLRQIAVGDVDADGDVDIYGPDATGGADKFFINNGAGVFTDEQALRMPPGLGSHSAATRFGDVDSDGDLDLFVGDQFSGNTTAIGHLYLNDGAGVFTESAGAIPMQGGLEPNDCDFLDVDRDFDLDLLINDHGGQSRLLINDGAGQFTDATSQLASTDSGLHYGPVACDVDADGDLDIWTDNVGPGYTEQLMINDGTGKFVDETAARVVGNPGTDDNGLACIDYDNDGDFDAAIMSLGNVERILRNDGAGAFELDPGTFSDVGDSTLWFEFGDLNGDGRLDCVTGQGESGSFVDRLYLGTPAATVDTQPPRIITVEQPGSTVGAGATPVLRYAVSDNTTTDEGPRLSKAFARVTVETTTTEVAATFMGGDLFRVALPAQNEMGAVVTVELCATDRRDNEGCSAPLMYTIEGTTVSSTSSSNGSGGSGGAGGGAGGSGGGGGGGNGGSGTGAGASGSNGSGAAGPFEIEDDSGCGCAVPGSRERTAAGLVAMAALMAGIAARGRRRRGRA